MDKIVERILLVITGVGAVIIIWLAFTPQAHADMCGPMPGLPSYSNGWVKGCYLYLPGTGGLAPAIPVVKPPTAPYPMPFVGGTGGLLGPGYQPGSGYSPLP